MHNFPLTRRLILIALGTLLLVDLGFAYFNSQMIAERGNPQQLLATQNRQYLLLKADVERATAIQKKIPEVLKAFDQYESSLPVSTKGYSVISQELADDARETHLVVDDVKLHEKDLPARKLTEVAMEATVTGDYAGVVRFLNRLQRSKNTYIVDSLQVDAPTQSPGQSPSSTLRVALHMRTYFRKV